MGSILILQVHETLDMSKPRLEFTRTRTSQGFSWIDSMFTLVECKALSRSRRQIQPLPSVYSRSYETLSNERVPDVPWKLAV